MDNHEYFSYKLFDQYFNNEEILLQEERGRLPNIEQIVAEIDNFIESEIVRQHCFQLQNLIYRTSINSSVNYRKLLQFTFFSCFNLPLLFSASMQIYKLFLTFANQVCHP